MKNLNHIFEPTACLSEEMMIAYVNDELSSEEKYTTEKHLNACLFCSAEIDGLAAMSNPEKLPEYIERINKKIDARIRPRKILPLARIKPFYSVAAALILLFGIGYFIKISFFGSVKDMSVAEQMNSEKTEDVLWSETADEDETVQEEENTEAVDIVNEQKESNEKADNENPILPEENIENEISIDETVIADDIENTEVNEDADEEPALFAVGTSGDSGTKTKEEKQPIAVSEIHKRIASDSKNESDETDEDISESEESKERKISFFGTTRSEEMSVKKSGETAEAEKEYEEAVKFYQKKEYKKAKKLLDKIISNKGLHQYDALWYRGLIYKAGGEPEKAKDDFIRVSKSNTKFSKDARKELK